MLPPPTAASSRAPDPPGEGAGPPSGASNWSRHVLVVAALWTVALLAYSNSFQAGFLFDSTQIILQDARLKAVTPQNVSRISTTEYWFPGLYRPFTTLTYLFNYAALGSGPRPASYHIFNFALHAANILLLYLLGLIVFEDGFPAFALAALWALHPVLTESVTNIVGRADLLAAFGLLGGLLCHIRAAAQSGWRKAAWLAGLLAAVTVGQFSKENAAMVVAVMLLYDLLFGASAAQFRQSSSARFAGYAAAALPILVYWICRARVLAQFPHTPVAFLDNPLTAAGFWTARLTAVEVLGRYLCLWLWPARLACDYSYNQIPLFAGRLRDVETWQAVAALLFWVAMAAWAMRSYRRNPRLCFFILFFLLTMAPTSNLVVLIGSIMAERFLYLPSIGFAGCAVLALQWACRTLSAGSPRAGFAAPVAFILICLVLVVRCYARNADWLDGDSLWGSAVQVAPASYKNHLNLAITELGDQPPNLDVAVRELEASLAIVSPLPDWQQNEYPYLMAGMSYRIKGDTLAPRNDVNPLEPDSPSARWYQRSLEALTEADRVDRSAPAANRNGQFPYPSQPRASGAAAIYEQLGHTYLRLRRAPPALAAYAHSRSLNPQPNSFKEMAAAYSEMNDSRRAAVTLLEGLWAFPGQMDFASQAAAMYRRLDPQSCAASVSPLRFNPQCPAVQADLCAAGRNVIQLYTQAGMPAQAAAVRQRVAAAGCVME